MLSEHVCDSWHTGQFNPLSPIEIIHESEDYPDKATVNRNQTGWHWFGGIVGKHADATLAMEEALDKLNSRRQTISQIHIFVQRKTKKIVVFFEVY